jgi:hypothetical protein
VKDNERTGRLKTLQTDENCSLWVSWTRLNSEPALLFGNTGNVMWGCSLEKTWILARCLDHASWQCPCSWCARCPGVLGKKSVMKLDHPPYLPDLALCNFWLFPKLKTALKGHRFSDISDIQGHVMTILQSIPEEEFQKCFGQCKHQLTKCTAA